MIKIKNKKDNWTFGVVEVKGKKLNFATQEEDGKIVKVAISKPEKWTWPIIGRVIIPERSQHLSETLKPFYDEIINAFKGGQA